MNLILYTRGEVSEVVTTTELYVSDRAALLLESCSPEPGAMVMEMIVENGTPRIGRRWRPDPRGGPPILIHAEVTP